MNPAKILVGLVVAAIGALVFTPAAVATNYTVSSNPYSVNHTILGSEIGNTYEVTASSGQRISYAITVSTQGGCAELYFVRGHNVDLTQTFQYYVAYSQRNCAPSYSNTFPVDSGDGTQFTIAVVNPNTVDVDYGLGVSTTAAPAIPSWVLGLVVLVVIVVVIALVGALIRRRRKPAPMPPMAPPPYVGPGAPMPPQQYPPQQPPYGGPPPPPP